MKIKKLFLLGTFFALAIFASAQRLTTEPHFAQVTNFAYKEASNDFFSVGDDGMVVLWNNENTGEHYQCSKYPIKKIAVHPFKNEIALYETDGIAEHKVSVWDWTYKNVKWSKTYTNTVTSLSYSANGTYLMVGTASIKGLQFYFSDNGFEKNLIKNSIGTVYMAQTSGTESSLIVYAQSGLIIYYDLKKGSEKARFKTEADLTNTTLYNNNMHLAGIKNGELYSIDALSGEVTKKLSANNAFLCTVQSDSDIIFVQSVQNRYTVRSMGAQKNENLQALDANAPLSAVLRTAHGFVFGTINGDIYRVEKSADYNISQNAPITKSTFLPIIDIAQTDEGLGFLLTENAILLMDENGTVEFFAENSGYKNIFVTDTDVYLWSKDSSDAIMRISLYAEDNSAKHLYAPNAAVQNFVAGSNYLLVVEGSSNITIIDKDTYMVQKRYNGSGYLDAVLLMDNSLYIGKSNATTPKAPLLHVDTSTGETVTLNIKANATYNFVTDGDALFGQKYSDNGKKISSSIFTYRPQTRDYKDLLTIEGDNASNTAFLKILNGIIFTDLPKNELVAISTQNSLLKRKVCAINQGIKNVMQLGNKLYVLNTRGTMQTFDAQSYESFGTIALDKNYAILQTGN